MGRKPERERLLAIDPTHRGFGFVVLEEGARTKRLVDWGTAHVSGELHDGCLARTDKLIERYTPDTVVVEDHASEGSRRCDRVGELIDATAQLARARGLDVVRYSRDGIREAFEPHEAVTKEEIAAVLAAHHPELLPRVPPTRKPWMSEDHRMAIFDAASLGWTHFHNQKGRGAV